MLAVVNQRFHRRISLSNSDLYSLSFHRGNRHDHAKARAVIFGHRACQIDSAIHLCDAALDYRKPKPSASRLRRVKRLEDSPLSFRGDSWPRVRHRYDELFYDEIFYDEIFGSAAQARR